MSSGASLRVALATAVAAAAFVVPAAAQTPLGVPPKFVKDINQKVAVPGSGSFPQDYFTVGGRTFFTAEGRFRDRELWVTDGTPEGTRLVKDIRPGRDSSRPMHFIEFKGDLFFTADDGTHGRELWRSDGTANGTRLVKDVNPGSDGMTDETGRNKMIVVNGSLVFDGGEMHVSDGTAAGTRQLLPKERKSRITRPTDFVLFKGLAYFGGAARDANGRSLGRELCVTNGSAAGTRVVIELLPGSSGSDPQGLTAAPDRIYFSALALERNRATGRELCVTDGTAAGTRLVEDFEPGARGSNPDGMVTFDSGKVVLSLARGVFRHLATSDGQTIKFVIGLERRALRGRVLGKLAGPPERIFVSGTPGFPARERLFAIEPDGFVFDLGTTFGPFDGDNFEAVGPKRAVMAADGSLLGRELMVVLHRGRPDHTTDVRPGSGGSMRASTRGERRVGVLADGRVVFTADDGASGQEPWVLDPAAPRKRPELLADVNPNRTDSFPVDFAGDGFGDRFAVFRANDGVNGTEVWLSDNTTRGTRRAADLVPGPGGSDPFGFQALSNELGDFTIFSADGKDGREPHVRSPKGTFRLADLNKGPASSNPVDFTPLGDGRMAFSAFSPERGREAFLTDGTSAGTVPAADIVPGRGSATPDQFALLFQSGALFMRAKTREFGSEPFLLPKQRVESAGAARLLKDIRPGPASSDPEEPTPVGDKLVFTADDGRKGRELWVTDGTTGGTQLVLDIFPGAESSEPAELTVGPGGLVFFAATHPTFGRELWVTDGTQAGTRLVKDLAPGRVSTRPDQLTFAGSLLFFRASDPKAGRELHRSDGTAAGTGLVHDILPGLAGSMLVDAGMLALGASTRVLFAADDGKTGREMWTSDGTAAGTVLLADVVPGKAGMHPRGMRRVGRTIFFMAHDEKRGFELYSYSLDALEAALADRYGTGCPGTGGTTPAIAADGQPLLGNGRFAVTLAGARASSATFLQLGAGRAALPVGGTCRLHVLPVLITLAAATGGGGSVRMPIPIPASRALLGAELFAQWATVDPLGAFLGGLTLSDALALLIGR